MRSVFRLQDTPYTDVFEGEGVITFPSPFTLGHYKTWYSAVFERDAAGRLKGSDQRLRQYRGALAVGDLHIDGLTEAELDPDSEELPAEVISFAIEAAEAYFGQMVIVGDATQSALRHELRRHKKHTVTIAGMKQLLPILEEDGYVGEIAFPVQFIARHYRAWTASAAMRDDLDPTHIENTPFIRQYRAALKLVQKWDVSQILGYRDEPDENGNPLPELEQISWKNIKRDPDSIPLPLASFLVEAADEYVYWRLNQKKLRVRHKRT